jgi:hypothetical protein
MTLRRDLGNTNTLLFLLDTGAEISVVRSSITDPTTGIQIQF